jgi:hypothetical protein
MQAAERVSTQSAQLSQHLWGKAWDERWIDDDAKNDWSHGLQAADRRLRLDGVKPEGLHACGDAGRQAL